MSQESDSDSNEFEVECHETLFSNYGDEDFDDEEDAFDDDDDDRVPVSPQLVTPASVTLANAQQATYFHEGKLQSSE
jgi:hypothetical protein